MKHFAPIDGLRAWMSWWVVCQHLLSYCGFSVLYPNIFIRLLSMGGLAVMVFVIISGFVIANLMLVRDEPYRLYIGRRFLRIYPLYFIAVLLALLLRDAYYDIISLAPWTDVANGQALLAEKQALPQHLLLHATLLHGLVPDILLSHASSSILAPAWSLSLEWQFYLLAPLLLKATFDSRLSVQLPTSILLLISVVAVNSVTPMKQWNFPSFLPIVIGFFILGMGTRVYLHHRTARTMILPALIVIINFLFYCRNYTGGQLISSSLPFFIWALVIFCCIYNGGSVFLSAVQRVLQIFLSSRRAVNMGLWSYSTYLLHVPLFVLALTLARRLGAPVTMNAYFVILLAACVVLVPLSWFTYHFVEQKVMRWGTARLMSAQGRDAERVTT
ncbi:MAG TPA: acyltransferase [Sphingobium sp.]